MNEIINKDDNDKNIIEILFIEDESDEINNIVNEDENFQDILDSKSVNKIQVVNFKGEGIDIDIF